MNHAKRTLSPLQLASLSVVIASALAGCGGGGGSASEEATNTDSLPESASTTIHSMPVSDGVMSPPQPPISAQPSLFLPSVVANGSTVMLECGRTYAGTLDLRGKSNVTVKTAGACGNAVLSPGREITGWSKEQGSMYSAAIDFDAAQLSIGGQPFRKAHWPSLSQTWARADSATSSSLVHALPNPDLAGATLVFKPYVWAVEARRITAYTGSTMTLESTGNPNFDGYPLGGRPDFYVEGKLWMLDEPGEWVVHNGRIYVMMPNGQTPEGRAWASGDQHGIDASGSAGVTIDRVDVYSANNGIHASNASNLRVTNVAIANSSGNGIMNSGGKGLFVDTISIRNSRHDAIAVKWGGGDDTITNSRIDATGTLGMPTNAHAAINVTAGSGSTINNNQVTNSGYIGIRSYRDSTVSNNVVDGACLVLTDCGGIFNSSRDKLPLRARIEGNTIRNVGPNQRLAWGVYLGDYANDVTVANNTISGNGNGLIIYAGANNIVTGNHFSASTQAHIQMSDNGTDPSVRGNVVTGNTMTSLRNEETYRLSSDAGTWSVIQFGSYDRNTYIGASQVFANFNGEPLAFAAWKQRTGQDASSSFQAP